MNQAPSYPAAMPDAYQRTMVANPIRTGETYESHRQRLLFEGKITEKDFQQARTYNAELDDFWFRCGR